MSKFLTLAFLLMLSSASAVAEPLSILVNADNPVMALSDQDLASCFLKSRSAWPENFPMHPVEIYGDNPAKNFFSQRPISRSFHAPKNALTALLESGTGQICPVP